MTAEPTGRGANRGPEPTWLGLLTTILKGMPSLPGAACIGLGDLFAAEHAGDVQRARKICLSCEAFSPCSDWIQGRRDVTGVVAGQLRPRSTPKPRRRPSDDERETDR